MRFSTHSKCTGEFKDVNRLSYCLHEINYRSVQKGHYSGAPHDLYISKANIQDLLQPVRVGGAGHRSQLPVATPPAPVAADDCVTEEQTWSKSPDPSLPSAAIQG